MLVQVLFVAAGNQSLGKPSFRKSGSRPEVRIYTIPVMPCLTVDTFEAIRINITAYYTVIPNLMSHEMVGRN